MGIFETFSKRQKKAKGEIPEVYQYDHIPEAFRVQVAHIWKDALGEYRETYSPHEASTNEMWKKMHDILAREKGRFRLHDLGHNHYETCRAYLLHEERTDVLDIIELTFRILENMKNWNDYELDSRGIVQKPKDAINELNYRFKEHGLGYQFINGQIIRIDSEYTHEKTIKPALILLHETQFKGAEEEFLKAHDHYLHHRNKEAIAEALKAFESTLRTICDERKWSYSKATAKPLLDIIFEKELLPAEMNSHFTSLRAVLESGLPTVRNTTSGHGQGKEKVTIPEHFVNYALNLAAANIIFLIQVHKAKKL